MKEAECIVNSPHDLDIINAKTRIIVYSLAINGYQILSNLINLKLNEPRRSIAYLKLANFTYFHIPVLLKYIVFTWKVLWTSCHNLDSPILPLKVVSTINDSECINLCLAHLSFRMCCHICNLVPRLNLVYNHHVLIINYDFNYSETIWEIWLECIICSHTGFKSRKDFSIPFIVWGIQ